MPEKQAGEVRKLSDDIVQKGVKLYQEQGNLQDTLVKLEMQIQEHKIVTESLEKLEPSRRCFRRMSGVLVERTVGQVLTAINDHLEKLQGVRTGMSYGHQRVPVSCCSTKDLFMFCVMQFQTSATASLKRKTEELQAFQKEHQITIKHPSDSRPPLVA